MKRLDISRRQFSQTTAAALATSAVPTAFTFLQEADQPAEAADVSLKGRIYKTLKIGMVRIPNSTLTEKFAAAKAAGFHGIELNSPRFDVAEVRQAITESELPVDGSVISSHWKIRHTSPDADQRKQALQDLTDSIRQTHAVGGNTVLLVAGDLRKNRDPVEGAWERAAENIRLAIPVAAQYGIHIAIENVWNNFMYDHYQEGHEQTADQFVKFVDEMNSPWVALQFDIGNHWRYGSMGDWIRQLDHRIIKLDLKGYSRKTQKFTQIGAGDLDWLDVRRALQEINFYGWAAAEIEGGDLNRLKEISANMDTVFNLT